MSHKLHPPIQRYFELLAPFSIAQERKETLQPLIEILTHHYRAGQTPRLNFICTHNSRRSQYGQAWAAVAAFWFGLKADVYSGGTEVTAFHPNAVETLARTGFSVLKKGGDNPIYKVGFSDETVPLEMFSKTFDDESIPQEKVIAVMTCAHAEENCPFIPGVLARIPLDYEDPKAYDGTPKEKTAYETRSNQIATEMKFVFNQVANNLK